MITKNLLKGHSGHTENNVIATELINAGWKDKNIAFVFSSIYNDEPGNQYGWYVYINKCKADFGGVHIKLDDSKKKFESNNMQFIIENGTSIYLKASSFFLYSRLKNEKSKRPLISKLTNSKLNNFIKIKLREREHIYSQAKYIINIENKNTEEILGKINALITSS